MFEICRSVSFKPDKDIPSLGGKVILVTGANAGLGKQSALEFSQHQPRAVWLAARSIEKAEAAAADIRKVVPDAPIKVLELDLASFESIKKAAKRFLSESDRLDILMCKAGIMVTSPGLTRDGYEIQFSTNHLGHALLTKLLLPVLESTATSSPRADVRVISLTSYGHTQWPRSGFRFDLLKSTANELGGYERYYQSGLANALWARQLAKKHPHLTVVSVHPGVVRT